MFAYLVGRVAGVTEDNLVLEVGQIGFNIKIPSSLPSLLPPIGEEVKIYTYTCVREDAFLLYGFLGQDDLDMFRLLITVNGIGPKGGLAILSAMSADDVRLAVLTQDVKAISKAPGVGAKTAQRLILDLKDKVSMDQVTENWLKAGGEMEQKDSAASAYGLAGAAREAVEALVALGYTSMEASRAVKKVSLQEGMTAEDVLKASLKHLSFL